MKCTDITTLLLLLLVVAATVLCGSNSGEFLNQDAFLARNIEETTTVLTSQMKKSCANDGISVSFRRESIMGLGVIIPSQLHLSSAECIATVNQSHFTLHTGFLDCDTKVKLSRNNTLATLTNKVIISPPTKFLTDDEDELGVAKEENTPVVIEFTCTYLDQSSQDSTSVPPTPVVATEPTEIDSAIIQLYNTDSYTSEVDLQYDITRGTSLYARVKAYGMGRELNTYIEQCYWTGSRHPGLTADTHYLIKEGCPVDRDVQFKEDSVGSPRKFLFRARRLYGSRPMYLHCELSACYGIADKQCDTQQNYCNREAQAPRKIFHASVIGGMTVIKRPNIVRMTTTPATSTPQVTTTAESRQPLPNTIKPKLPQECPPTIPAAPCNCPAQAGIDSLNSSAGMVSIEVTVVVTILSFVIGAAFIAVSWCVYIKTDPHRKMQAVSMSDDGLSSQESTVPTEKLMKQNNEITSCGESH